MKRIILLGATGSIGLNAAEVVRTHPDDFRIVAVAALRSRERCEALAREFSAKAYVGEDAAIRAVEENEADICLVATVGMSGLKPTVAAIEKGMDIALATKEVMVMAGEFVTALARKRGVRFLPVDSEHSAIFQCIAKDGASGGPEPLPKDDRLGLRASGGPEPLPNDDRLGLGASGGIATDGASGGPEPLPKDDRLGMGASGGPEPLPKEIDRLILTASGGPFLDSPADLSTVTLAEALNHPRWKMGPKVTVDSSTMMNKGFEILEARWLFDVPVDRIDVVVHPESIVHSLVTFTDGATLAQLSPPDMRVAIQYALSWPRRLPAERERLDLARLGALTFREPDERRFPCLALAKAAMREGGCATAVLAAADEWAVGAFAQGRIGYTDIAKTVEWALGHAPKIACDSLEAVWAANDWVWKNVECKMKNV